MSPQPVNQNGKKVKRKAIDRIRKRKKQNVAQYRMTNGKGNNVSKSVKVILQKISWKSDYICGTQNAATKGMNQIQHVPFAEQKKTPQST